MLVVNLSMLGIKPTGLGVYSLMCAQVLRQNFDVKFIKCGSDISEGEYFCHAPADIAIGEGRLAAIRRWRWLRSLVLPTDSVVYSPTHHGLSRVRDQIITIHDLIALRHPHQHWQQYIYFRYFMPNLLKNCRAVFAVSETTKQDIIERYSFPESKIYVVPNSVSPSRFGVRKEKYTGDPYLLMVGARYPHKNVDEVLDNNLLWRDNYRLKVVSCSGTYLAQLKKKVVDLKLSDCVEFIDYLTNDQLLEAYQSCSAFIYPSKWEGFGIPPLEALASGVPVIVSDIPVHHEVLGEAVFYVRLGDRNSWKEAFSRLRSVNDIQRVNENVNSVLSRYSEAEFEKVLTAAMHQVAPDVGRVTFDTFGVRSQ